MAYFPFYGMFIHFIDILLNCPSARLKVHIGKKNTLESIAVFKLLLIFSNIGFVYYFLKIQNLYQKIWYVIMGP